MVEVDGTRVFRASLRLPATPENERIICPTFGCSESWVGVGKVAAQCFLRHLINDHKLPILRYGDGSFVEEVDDSTVLDNLAPFQNAETETVNGVVLERSHGTSATGQVYVSFKRDVLRRRAQVGVEEPGRIARISKQVPPSVRKKQSRERYQAQLAQKDAEQLAEFRAKANARAKEHYKRKKEEEKARAGVALRVDLRADLRVDLRADLRADLQDVSRRGGNDTQFSQPRKCSSPHAFNVSQSHTNYASSMYYVCSA